MKENNILKEFISNNKSGCYTNQMAYDVLFNLVMLIIKKYNTKQFNKIIGEKEISPIVLLDIIEKL